MWISEGEVTAAIVKYLKARFEIIYPQSPTGRQLYRLEHNFGPILGTKDHLVRLAHLGQPLRGVTEDQLWVLAGYYLGCSGYEKAKKGSGGEECGERKARDIKLKDVAKAHGLTIRQLKDGIRDARRIVRYNLMPKYARSKHDF